MQEKPRVVIVGAGFGGLWAARALAGKPVEVLLLDKDNFHAFWPLLYQVAAAELEAEQIAYPVRSILRKKRNVSFLMGRVHDVDFEKQIVYTRQHQTPYDYLVLALGSASTYFGIPGAREHTFALKTIEEGIALRNHILRCFESTLPEADEALRRRRLTFVIVGGGPTGVEYAGALSELIYGPLRKDYRGINIDEVSVVLVEMMDTLLGAMPPGLGRYAVRRLKDRKVQVRLNTTVSKVTDETVHFDDGSCLDSETVIWTAGVRGAPLTEDWGLETGQGQRVTVLPTLQLPQQERVYAIGDLAAFEGDDGQLLPMLAPVAMQQGEHAARNIVAQVEGQAPEPFHYRDKGTLATIGRSAAVAHIFGRSFTGFLAWIIWLVIHLFQLIGFRNRMIVMINWAWSYLFFERMVRLILPEESALEEAVKGKRLDV